MLFKYLIDREMRTKLLIFIGMVLGVLYITLNLLFTLVYEGVLYLVVATYNMLLLICRYFAFELSAEGRLSEEKTRELERALVIASLIMSVAIFYSTIAESFKARSAFAVFTLLIYASFSFFRLLFVCAQKKEENKALLSLLNRIRILSLTASSHALVLQLLYASSAPADAKSVFSFASAFFSSYFAITASSFRSK